MTKSWLFLKKFQTSLLFSSESTLLLSAAWVVLQSKQSMFQRIFLKKSQFIVISDEKKEFLKKPFQPKSPWNGPFTFSLGKLCPGYQLRKYGKFYHPLASINKWKKIFKNVKYNLFPTFESKCDKKESSDENWPLKFGLPSRQSTLVFAAVNTIFLIISLTGNVIMFYLYSKCKVLRTPSNMLVINLSIANFLMHSKSWVLIVNSIDGGPLLGEIGKWISIIIWHKKHHVLI